MISLSDRKTVIDLQYPYDQDWESGYLSVNKEPRRVVALYNSHGDRTSTSYARYLMSTHLGRYLLPEEHVDHIDNDKLNDTISNLQILSLKANNVKEGLRRAKKNGRWLYSLCPVCHNVMVKDKRNTQNTGPCNKGKVVSCSRVCSSKLRHSSLMKDTELKDLISETQFTVLDY